MTTVEGGGKSVISRVLFVCICIIRMLRVFACVCVCLRMSACVLNSFK